MPNTSPTSFQRPLIIGEVLFDHFPNGKRVLGGAPFNVAWNLQMLGARPYFLSAVGDDEEGQAVRDRIAAAGMDLSGLQTDAAHPTGSVQVSLRQGEPRYEIVSEQAYDFVVAPVDAFSGGEFRLLYHGSLAWRSPTTRRTIQALRKDSGLPALVDINVRQPWFDLAWLPELIGDARWLKLNANELSELTGLPCANRAEIETASARLRTAFPSTHHWITCGAQGAYAIDSEGTVLFAEAPQPEHFVDAVGAGDAFAAVVILALLQNRPAEETLHQAVRFAGRVCGLQGATSPDPDFYSFR